MLYSDDVYLTKLRSAIMSYGVSSWSDQHEQAARRLETDLNIRWYRFTATLYGYESNETPFDGSKLLQGYDYIGSGTVSVSIGDIVVVPSSHVSGGTVGNYYQSISASGSINLSTNDFTGAAWSNVTADRITFRDCVSYYALFLAYRYLANKEREDDYADQRDYWMMKYQEELDLVLSGEIGYDFDGDGTIDSNEKKPIRYRIRRV